MTTPQPLAADFPVFTEDDWRVAVARSRGRGSDETRASTIEGDSLLRRNANGSFVGGRQGGERWHTIQRVDFGDVDGVVKAIRGDIAGGATGADIAFMGTPHPLGGTLPPASASELSTALAAVVPAAFKMYVDVGDIPEVAKAFVELAAAAGAEFHLASDPIAAFAIRGLDAAWIEERATGIEALSRTFGERGVIGDVVTADGRLWHAAGADEEQELGITLATFVALLRLTGAAGRIAAILAADSDQFRTIAKFRALRLLLARIAEIANVPVPHIRGETAWRTMSTRGPEMNILRATSAAFGAAVGGADSITVLPFDALGGGDSHGRRLARNTQTILAEEAQLFRVADPAAGSGAIEVMSEAFVAAGWARFQAIEAEGGILAAIAGGNLLADVAQVREARLALVNNGAMRMPGVNVHTGSGDTVSARVSDAGKTRLVFKRLAEASEGTSA